MDAASEPIRKLLDEQVKEHGRKVRRLDALLSALGWTVVVASCVGVAALTYAVLAIQSASLAFISGAVEAVGLTIYKVVGPSLEAHRSLLVAHRAAIFEILTVAERPGNERDLQLRLIFAKYLAKDASPQDVPFLYRQLVALQVAHGNSRYEELQLGVAVLISDGQTGRLQLPPTAAVAPTEVAAKTSPATTGGSTPASNGTSRDIEGSAHDHQGSLHHDRPTR